MHQPLISVIITVLNGGKTLSQCLLSIHNQSSSDYELVIVDGGSTDNTVEIINASPIRNKIVSCINGIGLYAGLNEGIRISKGKWLYFIGADDEFYDSTILQKVSAFINAKADNTKVLVGSVACIKQNTLLKPMFGSPYWMRHQVHHQGMFYDRDIFIDSGYNENRRIASDYEFNLELALAGVHHQSMDIIVCNFAGDGISETQIKHGYREMQQVHKKIFVGPGRYWAMGYFWLRRKTGLVLRKYKLNKISIQLKRNFG